MKKIIVSLMCLLIISGCSNKKEKPPFMYGDDYEHVDGGQYLSFFSESEIVHGGAEGWPSTYSYVQISKDTYFLRGEWGDEVQYSMIRLSEDGKLLELAEDVPNHRDIDNVEWEIYLLNE